MMCLALSLVLQRGDGDNGEEEVSKEVRGRKAERSETDDANWGSKGGAAQKMAALMQSFARSSVQSPAMYGFSAALQRDHCFLMLQQSAYLL